VLHISTRVRAAAPVPEVTPETTERNDFSNSDRSFGDACHDGCNATVSIGNGTLKESFVEAYPDRHRGPPPVLRRFAVYRDRRLRRAIGRVDTATMPTASREGKLKIVEDGLRKI
jgi:hypothetical protein